MNGNGTVAGATLGTVWNQSNQPAEGYKGLYRKEYGRVNGDSYERYDANTGEYTQYSFKVRHDGSAKTVVLTLKITGGMK